MAIQNQYFPQSVPHPGETLAEKLEEMEMGPKEFALRTGKPEKTIIAIVKGKSSITSDMAVQFEYVTKIPAKLWMNHQQGYDEYLSRKKRQKVGQEALAWVEKFPLAEMIKKGWLPPSATIEEKTMEMLAFFGFASHTAWEDYYFHQQLKVAFRISLSQTKESYAVSAWLRKGELQAAKLEAKEYSEKKFKDALPELKSIMVNYPTDFFNPLQGKILGAARRNINYIGAVDPADYNNGPVHNLGNSWAQEHVGEIWWDTDTVRFIDPNQDNITYASRRWGQVFPGS
jgi:addiction module HigA family antidote